MGTRIAGLWSDVVDGRPQLHPTLGRTDDPKQIARILGYLRDGEPVLRAPTLQDDHLDPARKRRVPLIYLTDGEWIWSGEHSYYLQEHGVMPEESFYRTMQEHGFRVPPVSKAAVEEALELLMGARA
jgi:hypothetical protein